MSVTLRISVSMILVSLASIGSLAQSNVTSPLLLKTSDHELQRTFDWAKSQALAYVGPQGDAVGDWYEAALPGRNAFCMRDVSHQTMGAHALGLAANNHNMLRQFAQNISESKDWASYWEIDRNGKPSPADYLSDDDFWYNLPANFDLMSAALRMYSWTGDNTYLNDPIFSRFYDHTVSEYPMRWSLDSSALKTRNRIMNKRLSEGKFVEDRGIPSYTEGQDDFVIGVDLMAAEYRALRFAADLARFRQQSSTARQYDHRADAIQDLIETKAWNPVTRHFYGFMGTNQKFFGEGDTFVLYFSAIKDFNEIQGALNVIKAQIGISAPNIEAQSYFPEILYRYGAGEAAYDQILDLSRADRERREYPEVSYSIIGAIVTGMMGVNVVSPWQARGDNEQATRTVIRTLPQLSKHSERVELDRLPVRDNVIDISHEVNRASSLTNVSGPALLWEPSFYGRWRFFMVDGKKVATVLTTDGQHRSITKASILVPSNSKKVVTVMSKIQPDARVKR